MKYHKLPFIPQEIKIELTYKCTLTCMHCSSDASSENCVEISDKICFNLIEQANNLGTTEIAFSGGEPLLCDYLWKAIELCNAKNIRSKVYTSGTVDEFKSIIDSLKSCGLDTIIFSLYSPIKEEHEDITRVYGSFEHTINSIKYAKTLKLDTELHYVVLARNYKRLPELCELARKLHVSRISLLRFVPQGRGSLLLNDIMSKVQYVELRKIIENLREKGNQIRTGSPFNFLLVNSNPACYSGINRLIIAPDLRIYPCDAFKQVKAEEIVGTLQYSSLEKHSLEDCWEKSPYLNSIRKYLTTEFVPPCSECINLEMCLSGCLAQKVIQYGNLEKRQDPLCIKS